MKPDAQDLLRLADLKLVQSAWDAIDTLPPLDFTEQEAVALVEAISRAHSTKESNHG